MLFVEFVHELDKKDYFIRRYWLEAYDRGDTPENVEYDSMLRAMSQDSKDTLIIDQYKKIEELEETIGMKSYWVLYKGK